MSRLVAMDPFLLARLVKAERDPLTAELCAQAGFAERVLARAELSYALLDGGDIVAGGGLVPIWHGRAEAWQLTSRHARPRQLVAAVAHARAVMDARQKDPAFARIEMYVRCCQRWALSFIAALGFAIEGRLKGFDPRGRDVWLCARVAPQAMEGGMA